jgi:hypothetical protein
VSDVADRDLARPGAAPLVGRGDAAAWGGAAGAGRAGARGRAAPWREHQPAVHLAQAVPRFRAEFDLPSAEPLVPAFAAVELAPMPEAIDTADGPVADTAATAGVIEIELPRGRVRIAGDVAPAVVTAALRALIRR